MSLTTYIIKRQGKRPTEAFVPEKLRDSLLASCLSSRVPEGQATRIADTVTEIVADWLRDKPEVTSDDLRRKAAKVLRTYHPEAAHLYKHYHLVI